MYAKKKRFSWGKAIALLASLLLMVTAISGTLAFLTDQAKPIQNTFTTSKVTTKVDETFNGTTKSNVSIQNTGDTTAWIRAAVVITWQCKDENDNYYIYGQAPRIGDDYSIDLNLYNDGETGNGWVKGADGFYYYKSPVEAGQKTGMLINSCSYIANAPEGYNLCVEIICSGLQYKPASVFNTNWASSGLKVNDAGTELVTKQGGTT